MAPRPRYQWDASLGRYRDTASGRLVSAARVRQVIDTVLRQDAIQVRTLAGQVRSGAISRDAWAAEMRQIITEVHLYSAAAARGGWAQMTPAAFGQVGAQVRSQLKFFEGFVAEVNAGLPIDGNFQRRSAMYVQAGRQTAFRAERQVQRERGMTEERNVLDPLIPEPAHCVGPNSCVAQTAKGWVPLGSLVPIGSRTCLTGCRCHLEFR